MLLLISLLLCGCNDNDSASSPATQKNVTETAANTAASRSTSSSERAEPRLSPAQQNRQTEQRIGELQQELTRARTQRIHLLQKREEINARIAAHQEEGMQLLESLKAKQRTGNTDHAAFEAAARSQLETALAHDTELTHALELAEQELSEVEASLATLTVDLDAARHVQSANGELLAR
jgi:chromosome segregation ATPase